jgi:hypothetical protein
VVAITEASPVTLEVAGGGLTVDSVGVTVDPAGLNRFAVTVPSPQETGVVFTAGAQVVAQDAYGNTVTGFDASANNVTITASNGGSMTNNVLDLAGDFVAERRR